MATASHAMIESVREYLRRKPFASFRIVMRSGERYEVADPEKVALGGTRVLLVQRDRTVQIKAAEIELVYGPRCRPHKAAMPLRARTEGTENHG